MEPELRTILESLPRKNIPLSKLEPHREADPRATTRGADVSRGCAPLEERLGLYVAPSTLHSFVKVRAKHRKRIQFELPPIQLATEESPVLDRVSAFKAKPVVRTAKPSRFVFRENEPLTLTSIGGEQ